MRFRYTLLHGSVERRAGNDVRIPELDVRARFGNGSYSATISKTAVKNFYGHRRFPVVVRIFGKRSGIDGANRYGSRSKHRRRSREDGNGKGEDRREERGGRFGYGAHLEGLGYFSDVCEEGSFTWIAEGSQPLFSEVAERSERVSDSEKSFRGRRAWLRESFRPVRGVFRPIPLARPFVDVFPVFQNGDPERNEKENRGFLWT